MGGDADTQACIAGAIAEAFYGKIPEAIKERAINYLPQDLKSVVLAFRKKYME
jgi:ADP-ribosylglycohydrolase